APARDASLPQPLPPSPGRSTSVPARRDSLPGPRGRAATYLVSMVRQSLPPPPAGEGRGGGKAQEILPHDRPGGPIPRPAPPRPTPPPAAGARPARPPRNDAPHPPPPRPRGDGGRGDNAHEIPPHDPPAGLKSHPAPPRSGKLRGGGPPPIPPQHEHGSNIA